MENARSADPSAAERRRAFAQDVVAELWRQHAEHGSAETLEALVIHYEPLARYLARRALAKAPAYQDREDILSYAHHGLLDALARFEPDRGLKFETYATRRIAGAIIDGQRRQDPLTRSARKQVKEMNVAISKLEEELDREPTIEEISLALGSEPGDVRLLMLMRQSLNASLDDLLEADHRPDGTTGAVAGLTTEDAVGMTLGVDELKGVLARRLPLLTDRERAFMVLYYCEHRTLREVARLLGMHETRAGQIRIEIMRALRVA